MILKPLITTIKGKIIFELNKFSKKDSFKYDSKIQNIITEIQQNGFVAIPNFYSIDECRELRNEIDNLIVKRKNENNLWTDELGCDNRCFAAEDDSVLIKKYHENLFLLNVAENYFHGKICCSNTLAAKIEYKKGNIGSGQGWHRDGNYFQFKAILYLCDVEIKNGPFQIIKGSHKFKNVLKDTITMKSDGINTRFTEEQVNKVIEKNPENYAVLTAKAGTLVFADVSTIHTGMPLSEGGYRYTLFNYYYPSYDDIENRKMVFKNVGKKKDYI